MLDAHCLGKVADLADHCPARPRPGWKHFLGVQGRRECQSIPAHCEIRPQNTLWRCPGHTLVLSHPRRSGRGLPRSRSSPLPEDKSLILSDSIAQWHQWLRYVREHPPSLEEQQQDLIRQAQIKQLARLADERWASKPSFLDKPKTQQSPPPTETSESSVNPTSESPQDASASAPSTSTPKPVSGKPEPVKEDPWAKANPGNPGDAWQPESWTPSSKR